LEYVFSMQDTHGGDIRRIARERGLEASSIIDFSASINPEGPGPAALEALSDLLGKSPLLAAYPEPHPGALTRALSSYLGVHEDQIAVGNGSTEFIYLLPRIFAPRSAMVVEPAFSEYARALGLAGAAVRPFFLRPEDGFCLDQAGLEKALAETRPQVLYMANPSNPIGRLESLQTMVRVAAACREAGTLFIVDEAFIDFNESCSLAGVAARSGNLVVLRSMTKFFGLAALRLGYIVAGADLIEDVRKHLAPWSVNALADAAARASLADSAYIARTRAWLRREALFMKEGLDSLEGLYAYPSSANYFTVRLSKRRGLGAPALGELLLKRRILIRDLSGVRGLGSEYFRVALRRREENALLLRELQAILRCEPTPSQGK